LDRCRRDNPRLALPVRCNGASAANVLNRSCDRMEYQIGRRRGKARGIAWASTHVVRGLHPVPRSARDPPLTRRFFAILVEDIGPGTRVLARTRSCGATCTGSLAQGRCGQRANRLAFCGGSAKNVRGSTPLEWRRPSRHDRDRPEILKPTARSIDDAF
jgi:hypothetical protein